MVRWDDIYFGGLGVGIVTAGAIVFLRAVGLAPSGVPITVGVVTLSGALFRGIVLLAAGLLYLQAAAGGLGDRRNQATVFLGSLMIWIIAGTELLALILGAIPGSPDVWVAGVSEIFVSLGPPYPPSILAAVFALVAVLYTQVGGERL